LIVNLLEVVGEKVVEVEDFLLAVGIVVGFLV